MKKKTRINFLTHQRHRTCVRSHMISALIERGEHVSVLRCLLSRKSTEVFSLSFICVVASANLEPMTGAYHRRHHQQATRAGNAFSMQRERLNRLGARGVVRGAMRKHNFNTSPASFSLPTSRESENVPCCVPDKRDIFDNFKMSRGTHKMSRIYGTFFFEKNVPRSQSECPAGHFVFFENVPAKKNVPKMSRFYGTFSGHFDILCPAGPFSFFRCQRIDLSLGHPIKFTEVNQVHR